MQNVYILARYEMSTCRLDVELPIMSVKQHAQS